MSCTKLITQHSNTPDIYHFIVLVSQNNLRRHIIKCTTEGSPLGGMVAVLFASKDGPAEISQFYYIVREHDVFGLDVSMYNTLLVHILECFDGLAHVVAGLDFSKVLLLT